MNKMETTLVKPLGENCKVPVKLREYCDIGPCPLDPKFSGRRK